MSEIVGTFTLVGVNKSIGQRPDRTGAISEGRVVDISMRAVPPPDPVSGETPVRVVTPNGGILLAFTADVAGVLALEEGREYELVLRPKQ